MLPLARSLTRWLCDYDTDNKLFNVFGTLCDEIEVASEKKGMSGIKNLHILRSRIRFTHFSSLLFVRVCVV